MQFKKAVTFFGLLKNKRREKKVVPPCGHIGAMLKNAKITCAEMMPPEGEEEAQGILRRVHLQGPQPQGHFPRIRGVFQDQVHHEPLRGCFL